MLHKVDESEIESGQLRIWSTVMHQTEGLSKMKMNGLFLQLLTFIGGTCLQLEYSGLRGVLSVRIAPLGFSKMVYWKTQFESRSNPDTI